MARGRGGRARSPLWARRVTPLVALAIAGALLIASAGTPRALEAVAVLAAIVGLGLAFGAGPAPTACAVAPHRGGAVAASTAAAIDALDRVEHRRFELGAPWPQAVVGPTGVSVVDLCPLPGPLLADALGVRQLDSVDDCDRCDRALALARRIRTVLAQAEDTRTVPVRILTVVAQGTDVVLDADAPPAVVPVPADRLRDALARGPVLPMAVVDRAFLQLARLAGIAGEGHASPLGRRG